MGGNKWNKKSQRAWRGECAIGRHKSIKHSMHIDFTSVVTHWNIANIGNISRAHQNMAHWSQIDLAFILLLFFPPACLSIRLTSDYTLIIEFIHVKQIAHWSVTGDTSQANIDQWKSTFCIKWEVFSLVEGL